MTQASENLPQHLQHSTSLTTRLSEAESALAPINAKSGTAELMACLTLVAPSGMSTEDRQAWVAVAKQTLSGIPGDLLQFGCKKARETCRFASEIVPTIMAEVGDIWERRKRTLATLKIQWDQRNMPRLTHEELEYVGAEQMRELLKQLRKAA
jgi:hypothetical protein